MDIGGKNTQEEDQVRIWASPIAGPETSTALEGILGEVDCDFSAGKDSDGITQEKH